MYLELAKKSQSGSPDILIGMLKILKYWWEQIIKLYTSSHVIDLPVRTWHVTILLTCICPWGLGRSFKKIETFLLRYTTNLTYKNSEDKLHVQCMCTCMHVHYQIMYILLHKPSGHGPSTVIALQGVYFSVLSVTRCRRLPICQKLLQILLSFLCVKYIFFWFHQSVGFKGNIAYAKKHITSAMECADEAVFTFARVI